MVTQDFHGSTDSFVVFLWYYITAMAFFLFFKKKKHFPGWGCGFSILRKPGSLDVSCVENTLGVPSSVPRKGRSFLSGRAEQLIIPMLCWTQKNCTHSHGPQCGAPYEHKEHNNWRSFNLTWPQIPWVTPDLGPQCSPSFSWLLPVGLCAVCT